MVRAWQAIFVSTLQGKGHFGLILRCSDDRSFFPSVACPAALFLDTEQEFLPLPTDRSPLTWGALKVCRNLSSLKFSIKDGYSEFSKMEVY
jgi:hypothetical protein